MICNNSRADTFERCNREYFLNYEIFGTGLVGMYTEDFFRDGISMHAGLASWHTKKDLPLAQQVTRDEYVRLSDVPDEDKIAWATKMLRTYSTRKEALDDFTVLEAEADFRVVLGEFCFNCRLPYPVVDIDCVTCPNCGSSLHWWVGRTDLNVHRNGGIKVLDHKTTKGTANASYIASFDHSFQLIGYSYGTSKQNNTRVSGYGVNVLKKLERVEPYTVQCRNCSGTGQLKTRACSKCGGTGAILKEPNQLFVRKWFGYNTDKKHKFINTRTVTLNRIEEERAKFDNEETRQYAFPMNAKACHMMRSGGSCKFADLCWSPTLPAQKWWEPSDALLSTKYKQRNKDYVNLMEEELD